MTTLVRLASRAILLAAVIASGVAAEDDYEINYDAYVKGSCLTVWLDLAPLISSQSVQRLRDGVDLAIECRAELGTPRRFWGDRSIATHNRYLRLSHREVTSDFLLTTPGDSLAHPDRRFGSLATLHAYLRDSVDLCVAALADLDSDQRYFLSLSVTTISMFDINIDNPKTDSDESESPVKFLFRQFLLLTDYGREQYSTRSSEFQISDLEIGP
jgi:hypothetical protein